MSITGITLTGYETSCVNSTQRRKYLNRLQRRLKNFQILQALVNSGQYTFFFWIFIAYDAEIDVPDEMLYDLAGPNVRLMEKMCQYAGFTYKQLYKRVMTPNKDF